MQAGLTCFETGMVRCKNSTNVAVKNLTNFCVSALVSWFVGYELMFGTSNGGSRLGLDSGVPAILIVTLAAGSSGGLAGVGLSDWLRRAPSKANVMNGILSSLVAVTPCARLAKVY